MNNSFKNSLNNESAEWRARLAYKCAICGKEFDNIQDRAKCELACLKEQEEEKKKKEHAARKKEVDEAVARAEELKRKYIQDYGAYVRTCHVDDLDELINFADLLRVRLP